jgi:hypothetical protein
MCVKKQKPEVSIMFARIYIYILPSIIFTKIRSCIHKVPTVIISKLSSGGWMLPSHMIRTASTVHCALPTVIIKTSFFLIPTTCDINSSQETTQLLYPY